MTNPFIKHGHTFALAAGIAWFVGLIAFWLLMMHDNFLPFWEVAGLFQWGLMIPVAVVIFLRMTPSATMANFLIMFLGVTAFIGFFFYQTLVLTNTVSYDQSMSASALLNFGSGIWWLLVSMLPMSAYSSNKGFVLLGMICGLSGLFIALGFFTFGSFQSVLVKAGVYVGVFAVPIWLFWLSFILRSK